MRFDGVFESIVMWMKRDWATWILLCGLFNFNLTKVYLGVSNKYVTCNIDTQWFTTSDTVVE